VYFLSIQRYKKSKEFIIKTFGREWKQGVKICYFRKLFFGILFIVKGQKMTKGIA